METAGTAQNSSTRAAPRQVSPMAVGQARMRAYDFFSGCGGTSAGFRKSGIRIVGGLDLDRDAGLTFRRNFPDAAFLDKDIRQVRAVDLDRVIGSKRTHPLVFSACAPCQPFSRQNRLKREDDDRRSLLDELRRFVRRFRPDYIFLENVPGMQKGCQTEGPLPGFLEFLGSLGYHTDCGTLQMVDYGIPQYRTRLVVVASRVAPILLPAATHGQGTGNPVYPSVWDAIGRFPPLAAGQKHPSVPNHVACSLSDINMARIKATPEGGSRTSWPEHLVLDCHRGFEGHADVYGRLHRGRPASALTTRCISLSNGRFGHPTQDRALSVREAAAIQTFEDTFVFEGSATTMAQQIGNAVPTRLAEVFGAHFQGHWKQNRKAR